MELEIERINLVMSGDMLYTYISATEKMILTLPSFNKFLILIQLRIQKPDRNLMLFQK